MKKIIYISLLLLLISFTAQADTKDRYFLSGDGKIHLYDIKTRRELALRYREEDGTYPATAQRKIEKIFGVGRSDESISLRLISLLDYLQDHFKGDKINIVSGYRSPEYNAKLRKKGKLAAPTSLHIEGMAADIEIPGADARQMWEYVRSLDCCGVGYYHGKGIHIDTGPSRFWDETSAKVDKNLGAHNKLILLRTDEDIYLPGETLKLSLARVTDYPISVRREVSFVEGPKKLKILQTISLNHSSQECIVVKNRKEAHELSISLPQDFHFQGRIQLNLEFCDKNFPEMPESLFSNPISIRDR